MKETMDGSPALVTLYGSHKFEHQSDDPYVTIKFQAGPVPDGVNGCAVEDVIDLLIVRLEGFQKGAFACVENDRAIFHLAAAKSKLNERTAKRQAQGVEGTMAPHQS